MKRKYTSQDYFKMLKHNVNNAVLTTNQFDSGNFSIATQLIGVIRILVHDTSFSTSLLKRLNDKRKIFYHDTSKDYPEDTFHLQSLLFAAYVKIPGNSEYKQMVLPKLYFEDNYTKTSSFKDWWENPIIIIDSISYSRKDIVLLTAHKHGILHSDVEVDENYYEIAENLKSFAYYTETLEIDDPNTNIEIVENTLYALIRQIAHELIQTLIFYYDLDIEYGPSSLKIKIAQPIYSLEVAINPDFEKENKDIIRQRDI